MEYYSAIKKNEIMLFAAMMNLEIIILSEVSQTKMTNIMISLIFRISFFFLNYINELIYKIETDLQILKTNLW